MDEIGTPFCITIDSDTLTEKTVTMMRRLDPSIPANLSTSTNLTLRHEFFGNGYAISTPATDDAIAIGREQLDLQLEITYSGKAMAALLADLEQPDGDTISMLFWNTYHAMPTSAPSDRPLDEAALPEEFLRYFE